MEAVLEVVVAYLSRYSSNLSQVQQVDLKIFTTKPV